MNMFLHGIGEEKAPWQEVPPRGGSIAVFAGQGKKKDADESEAVVHAGRVTPQPLFHALGPCERLATPVGNHEGMNQANPSRLGLPSGA